MPSHPIPCSLSRSVSTRSLLPLTESWRCRHGIFPTSSTLSRYRLFSVTGCVGAMQGLKSHAASDCPFNVWTDVESSATFTLGVPSSFETALEVWQGQFWMFLAVNSRWDRYTVRFHKARGADHNVHIIYGKNLTDFKMEKSIENTITGVHPYWVDNETRAVMELPEKVVLQSKRSIPYQKITVLDCTSNFQEKPSEAALREYAQNYIDTTDLTEPEIDIKIDFYSSGIRRGMRTLWKQSVFPFVIRSMCISQSWALRSVPKSPRPSMMRCWNVITASRSQTPRSAAGILL